MPKVKPRLQKLKDQMLKSGNFKINRKKKLGETKVKNIKRLPKSVNA